MQICKFSLRIVGIWPDANYHKKHFHKYRSIGIFILVSLFINLSQTIKLFMIFNDIELFSEVLCKINLPVLVVLLMIAVFIRKHEDLTTLVMVMKEDWNTTEVEEEKLIMLKMAKSARKISLICTFLSQATFVSHTLSELLITINNRFQSPGNLTYRLYLVSYFPYDTNSSPKFELTWLTQCSSTFLATLTYSGVHSLFAVFVMHLCGQFNILRIRITSTINKLFHGISRGCVEIIEDSFNMLFLAEILACSIQFCLQGFQLVIMTRGNEKKLPFDSMIVMIFFLTYLLTFLFIYCYLAEQLRRQSAAIVFAAYKSQWYNLPSKEAKNLLLLMQRSGIPSTLTAGNFFTLSLQLFNKILKTSAGYFSMLLTITRENVND
ncbi:odorant receptor 13a-like [Leptopilina heterotoma]|uniref:odorant receptor 13a-like n=1 Tax=Leptopilina heterotoma TaxID=63436 RepID=UPI001CA94792|nr:odorant receptor 13a-like [Leptopilina heterotoma]